MELSEASTIAQMVRAYALQAGGLGSILGITWLPYSSIKGVTLRKSLGRAP